MMNSYTGKTFLVATVSGFLAGVFSALTLYAMTAVQNLIWQNAFSEFPIYIFLVIMCGGGLIALLEHANKALGIAKTLPQDLDAQVLELNKGIFHKKQGIILALMAIVAVGFGGSVGPEAGLIAVVAELSALVAWNVRKSQALQKIAFESGVSGALSGFYGVPLTEDLGREVLNQQSRWQKLCSKLREIDWISLIWKLLAASFGVLGFWLVFKVCMPEGAGGMHFADATFHLQHLLPVLLIAFCSLLPAWLFNKYHHLPKIFSNLRLEKQILLFTFLFALLAAWIPIVRFSGHHELVHMLEHGLSEPAVMLVGIGLAKLLALKLCLFGRWRGGEIFPLIFSGAMIGAGLGKILDVEMAFAMPVAMAALTAYVWKKPVATGLIVSFFAGLDSFFMVIIGVLVAVLVGFFQKDC